MRSKADETFVIVKTSVVECLEQEFPFVFDTGTYLRPVKHNTLHFIETEGAPVRSHVRRLSPEMRDNFKKEFDHLLDLDIIEPSNSPYGSATRSLVKAFGLLPILGFSIGRLPKILIPYPFWLTSLVPCMGQPLKFLNQSCAGKRSLSTR